MGCRVGVGGVREGGTVGCRPESKVSDGEHRCCLSLESLLCSQPCTLVSTHPHSYTHTCMPHKCALMPLLIRYVPHRYKFMPICTHVHEHTLILHIHAYLDIGHIHTHDCIVTPTIQACTSPTYTCSCGACSHSCPYLYMPTHT